MQGYYYRRGNLIALPVGGVHSEIIGNIADAIDSGIVRIRDHGSMVAFQGKSKRAVNTAFKKFCDEIKIPALTAFEWPGKYQEF
jgi:hypothetical protein